MNCKAGDGFAASFVVGKLSKLQSSMLEISKQSQGMNRDTGLVERSLIAHGVNPFEFKEEKNEVMP